MILRWSLSIGLLFLCMDSKAGVEVLPPLKVSVNYDCFAHQYAHIFHNQSDFRYCRNCLIIISGIY